MFWTPRRLAAATLVASLAMPSLAFGQPSTRSSDAERLFREGRALVDKGDYAAACPKFLESEKLDPAPGTLLSLADCEEREKHLVKAKEHYTLAASGFPKNDPRRAFATGRAQAIEKRLVHPTFRLLSEAPADSVVMVNDTALTKAELGTAMTLDPGELRVKVSAAGRQDKTFTVTMAEGESKTIECEAGAPAVPVTEPAAKPTTTTTTAPPSSKTDVKRTLSYVSFGVGGASLIAGGITGVLAASSASTVKDHCDDAYVCDQEGVDAASDGRLFAPLSTVTLIVGVALVGVGTYLFVTSGKKAAAPSTQKAMAVVKAIAAGGVEF